jgi:hypothetical protein
MTAAFLLQKAIRAGLLIFSSVALVTNAQTGETNPLVEGNTAFALDLYGHLGKTPGNLFFFTV